MPQPDLSLPGLTMGEAAVLIGQLAGEPAENIGGWTLIFQHRANDGIGVLSSAISAQDGFLQAAVLTMLLDAASEIVSHMDES